MPPLRLQCVHATDHLVAAALAKRYAMGIGFDEQGAGTVGIAVAELVSNAVRHAGAGTLELEELPPPRPGLRIAVSDRGPGLSAVQQATLAAISKRELYAEYGTLQQEWTHGLGAVLRLLENTEIASGPNGTLIIGCCYLLARR